MARGSDSLRLQSLQHQTTRGNRRGVPIVSVSQIELASGTMSRKALLRFAGFAKRASKWRGCEMPNTPVNLTAQKLRLWVPSALRAPTAGYFQRWASHSCVTGTCHTLNKMGAFSRRHTTSVPKRVALRSIRNLVWRSELR